MRAEFLSIIQKESKLILIPGHTDEQQEAGLSPSARHGGEEESKHRDGGEVEMGVIGSGNGSPEDDSTHSDEDDTLALIKEK
jgi:hypothetical protein